VATTARLGAPDYEGTRTAGYLNTATYGLPSGGTLDALARAAADWRSRADWQRWEEDGEACRELFAGLAGARPGEIALLPAVSAASGVVAASLATRPGDNVVCFERDFESTIFPWVSLERGGVELRAAPLSALADAVDERTVLVAISTVQSSDGQVADLEAIKAMGVALFVDATQSAGALPIELGGIDYLSASAYKWLCCPRGISFLYVRPERLEAIEPWLAGWKSTVDPYDDYYGLPRRLTQDARRLDLSLPWLLMPAARASLELIARLGVDRIAEHDLALARRFCAGLRIPETGSPIVQLAVPDAEHTLQELQRAGIQAARRGGALRFSFHFYNDGEDVDRALEVLAPIA
jgi:selenocysteine lyase/cysteine desulfurase